MSEEKETKNQKEEEQISENTDPDDLNNLTYEELLEPVSYTHLTLPTKA